MPRGRQDYSKADLHLHTARGDGMASVVELLEYTETKTDLDLIAVTDHDQLAPSLEAREEHSRRGYHFGVITGVEITTLQGHLLALGIERPVPSFRSLPATLDAVHKQGGLCLIPHPMSWLTRSIGRRGIEGVLARRAQGLWFDGLELSNQSPAGRQAAAKVRRLNEERYHLPVAGGSDAHYLPVMGTAWTGFRGEGVDGFKAALAAGATWAERGPAPTLAQLGLGQVVRQSWRGLWATPRQVARAPLAWARARR